MSDTLLIRHLPDKLSTTDKIELLKYFGAVNVNIPDPKCHTAFATFSSNELASQALHRLHQLQIGKRRLVAEYTTGNNTSPSDSRNNLTQLSDIENNVRKFILSLNSWNCSVDFNQPPPPHSKYKYPTATPEIIINIAHGLIKHVPFYTQVIHLMNKMSLDSPFNEVSYEATLFFKNNILPYFIEKPKIVQDTPNKPNIESSETETELSSEENVYERPHHAPIAKRKRKAINKSMRAKVIGIRPKRSRDQKPHMQTEDIFEMVPLTETKKIAVNVSQDLLTIEVPENETVGSIGKMYPALQTHETISNEDLKECNPERPISKKELLNNKISFSNMKILPVFRNYHPGEPSQRLYVKNLSKAAIESDIHRIFKRYINQDSDEHNLVYDVRLMQEGRMKGQAFVTLPSVTIAEKALNETNGFILKDKPMVVQFARSIKPNSEQLK